MQSFFAFTKYCTNRPPILLPISDIRAIVQQKNSQYGPFTPANVTYQAQYSDHNSTKFGPVSVTEDDKISIALHRSTVDPPIQAHESPNQTTIDIR